MSHKPYRIHFETWQESFRHFDRDYFLSNPLFQAKTPIMLTRGTVVRVRQRFLEYRVISQYLNRYPQKFAAYYR